MGNMHKLISAESLGWATPLETTALMPKLALLGISIHLDTQTAVKNICLTEMVDRKM